MASKTYLAFNCLFHLICISLGIYWSTMLVFRYMENEDTPKISYRKFHETLEDSYPEFTICFRQSNPDDTIYKERYLQEHSLDETKYQKYLRGDGGFWKKKQLVNLTSEIDFGTATLGVKKLIPFYNATYHDGSYLEGQFTVFNVTYQVPSRKCFTRRSDAIQSLSGLFRERMVLNLNSAAARIYVHYPNQVLRSVFGKGVAWKSIFSLNRDMLWETSEDGKTSTKIKQNGFELQLSQINVIKRRPNGKIPCNPDVSDDTRLWKEILQRAGCIPPYWKQINEGGNNLQLCGAKDDFEEIVYMAEKSNQDKKDILASVGTPCNEMRTRVDLKPVTPFLNDYKMKANETFVRILYMTDDYQELRNVRDFDKEMLWSNIGGFIGIFAGYGLLQVLIGILDIIAYFKPSKSKQ